MRDGITEDRFLTGIAEGQLPTGLSPALEALWHDARGDWHRAHGCVDSLEDPHACRVHAYLHRKEGDDWNAGYWYGRCGVARPDASLQEEWSMLVRAMLQP